MDSISSKTKIRVWGTHDAWSFKPKTNSSNPGILCDVSLEIQGNKQNGYHLVMSPSGFFTADYWYATKQEALIGAEEIFGVSKNEWI